MKEYGTTNRLELVESIILDGGFSSCLILCRLRLSRLVSVALSKKKGPQRGPNQKHIIAASPQKAPGTFLRLYGVKAPSWPRAAAKASKDG